MEKPPKLAKPVREKRPPKPYVAKNIVPCLRCGKPHNSKYGGRYCSSRCRYTPVVKPEKAVRTCKQCSKPIGRTSKGYCSSACFHLGSPKERRPCAYCGIPLIGKSRISKYCSAECFSKARPKKVLEKRPDKACAHCGTAPIPQKRKFCSTECGNKNAYQKDRAKAQLISAIKKKAFVELQKTCGCCGGVIQITFHTQGKKFCSSACAKRSRRRRQQTKPHERTRSNLSRRLWRILHDSGDKKQRSILAYLGCSSVEISAHIEKQFVNGMNWSNYGVFGWHIDHIIPCHRFDLSIEEHCSVCFNWRNLRPLWGLENSNRQHWMNVEDRLFLDPELYRMAMAIEIKM